MIEFIVPAIPIAQPRDRAVAIKGKGGKVHAGIHPVTRIKNSDGTWKPHPIAAFKATVRMVAEKIYKGPPMQGPLRVDLLFVFPREKSKFWSTKPMPRYWHFVKPDRDNCDKSFLDSLTGLVWVDDNQVCAGEILKVRASGYEQPHVEIRITQLDKSIEPPSLLVMNHSEPIEDSNA